MFRRWPSSKAWSTLTPAPVEQHAGLAHARTVSKSVSGMILSVPNPQQRAVLHPSHSISSSQGWTIEVGRLHPSHTAGLPKCLGRASSAGDHSTLTALAADSVHQAIELGPLRNSDTTSRVHAPGRVASVEPFLVDGVALIPQLTKPKAVRGTFSGAYRPPVSLGIFEATLAKAC